MKFMVTKEITMERNTSYNISFQVSYSICNFYLTKLTFYQNPKEILMCLNPWEILWCKTAFLFYLLPLYEHGYVSRKVMWYCPSSQRKRDFASIIMQRKYAKRRSILTKRSPVSSLQSAIPSTLAGYEDILFYLGILYLQQLSLPTFFSSYFKVDVNGHVNLLQKHEGKSLYAWTRKLIYQLYKLAITEVSVNF